MQIAILAPLLFVLGGLILYFASRGEAALIPGEEPSMSPNLEPPDRDLSGTGLSNEERAEIIAVAESFSIDARALAALRRTENGGPGREFGVLSVPAPTYHEQATVAARTLRNTIQRYELATFTSAVGPDGRLTADFLRYFSARYAPLGAGNDPTNLNQFHAGNLIRFYGGIDFA